MIGPESGSSMAQRRAFGLGFIGSASLSRYYQPVWLGGEKGIENNDHDH